MRFENQDATEHHLEDLKKVNEREIVRLREEKEKMEQDFAEQKYTGEAKMSRLFHLNVYFYVINLSKNFVSFFKDHFQIPALQYLPVDKIFEEAIPNFL